MKKITCYDCVVVFESETAKDVLEQMHEHYMKEHKEIITGVDEEGKKAWMAKFTADWAKAASS